MTILLALTVALQTYSLPTTDDVWLYPHAQDQLTDPLLRVWGDGTKSVGDIESSTISFSLLRFDLSSVVTPVAKLKKATLVLYHDSSAGFTESESKKYPLEVRTVTADFTEKSWTGANLTKFTPSAEDKAVFGTGFGTPSTDGKPFKILIDLLSGPNDFRKSLGGGAIAFALTSRIEPAGSEGPIYNIFSRAAEKAYQPMLILEYSN